MKRRLAENLYRWSIIHFICVFCILVSVSAVYASGGGEEGGHAALIKDYVWRMFNFAILVVVIYKFLGKKVKDFFTERREGIKVAMAEAIKAKEEAEAKFKEYSERLAKASGEIDGISEMIKAQGAMEKP
jgi:F-type H+-transporting ATPase subunit b